MMRIHRVWVLVACLLPFAGCVTESVETRPSNLTPGMTKKFIVPGKTSQAEVMEIFGPPNLVTHKDGTEIWTYDQVSQEITSSGGFLTIILAGYGRQRVSSHRRSTMLIIYFNARDVVQDYRLSATNF